MSELAHKERTLQDIIDEMTPEQRDVMDVVIGAAIEDEVIEDESIIDAARALPMEVRQLIVFTIGGILDKQDNELAQANLKVDNFLEHFGVKGMKWGVRNVDRGSGRPGSKSQQKPKPAIGSMTEVKLSGSSANSKEGRAVARAKVRSGTASAQDAHVAALKTTGHRVANAFLGDKTFWKGMAITAGVATTVAAGAAVAPLLMPASTLAAIGGGAYFAAGSLIAPSSAVAVQTGSAAVMTAGYTAAYVGANVAGSVLGVTNLVRAVRGNTRIDNSYSQLGSNVAASYQKGLDRTAKILRKDGGLGGRKVKRALKQSEDLRVGSFLEHHLDVTLGSMKSGA